jgi:hypothetical protein
MQIDFKVKSLFFDQSVVAKLIDKKTKKALSKVGAYIRRRAQTSIRYKDKPSRPGQPPHGHRSERFTRTNRKTGKRRSVSPLRELIFFAYNPDTKSVVVGPVVFAGARKSDYLVPSVIEKGGLVSLFSRGKKRRARYRPRPFMRPALLAELPNIPNEFKEQ